jgi:hypothetical protein
LGDQHAANGNDQGAGDDQNDFHRLFHEKPSGEQLTPVQRDDGSLHSRM